ncbi:immune inhibitor A peptidase M6-domain-containing protein [Lasiosphaeris hirsuta]|uniref:Immune inhibitor A peptidase M6-domain-containing protein n=1 Tax=Lasiosphaeris hirsuta TaxID=260670 RepID=A0AA40AA31_9PEZI|nr:immune inhibitor A peptidase M6-domain-containing protein [Lasiosphaeris hirsuta]
MVCLSTCLSYGRAGLVWLTVLACPTRHNGLCGDQCKTNFTLSTIVVLVDFPDKKMGSDRVDSFNHRFFGPKGNVHEYYHEVSNGKVSFTGDVIGPFTLPKKLTQYANKKSGMGKSEPNVRTMARDTVNAIKTTHDLASYDNNGNGLVDAFVIVHAGWGAEEGGPNMKNGMWSLQWYIDEEPILVGGAGVFAFTTIPENALLGVCVHEVGHLVFSWPDLYDGDPIATEGLGPWCLMAGGSWLGSPPVSKPCHPSAWCKASQGWVQVINHIKNATIKLLEVKDSHQVHRLWTNGEKTSAEYFLLENRQKKQYDANLPESGLFIFHVDDKVEDNDNELHYKFAMEQADGKNQLATEWKEGDQLPWPGDPFPGITHVTFNANSEPNSRSYAKKDTFVSVTRISDSAQTMTMDITVKI